ncbi:visinin-like protein 1 [Pelomyxa schiedti]|nr:visinin-like protein 1 [Pelomyxa schiedti]
MGSDASKPHAPSDSEVDSLASDLNLTVAQVKTIMSYWPARKDELKLSRFKRFIETLSTNMPDIEFLSTKGFAEQLFWLFDKDHNGMVSKREFLAGLSILSAGDPTERAKLFFEACDQDGNGQITKMEFVQALRVSLNSCTNIVKMQIEAYIRQNPGRKLSSKLISKMLATTIHIDADQFAELAFRADTDHTGTLSLSEWMTSCNQNAAISRILSFACGDLLVDLEEVKLNTDAGKIVTVLTQEYPILDRPTIENLLREYDNAAALQKLKRRCLTGSLGFGF